MSKKRKIPFWIVSALCATVAAAAAFVYSENLLPWTNENFLPWPKGAPPKIAGKWKLVSQQKGTNYTDDVWDQISVDLEILQQGESFGLLMQELAPFYAPEVGTLKSPNNVKIKVYNTRALSPVGYAIAEGHIDTSDGHMIMRGTYKAFHHGSSEYETGVWMAKRVGEPETKPSQISLVEQLKRINALPRQL